MRRLSRALLPILALLVFSIGRPGLATAGNPNGAVPPVRANGPVVLPNGRVLRMPPAGATGPSEMATAWLEHEKDALSFDPGARPQPLRSGGATLSVANASGSTTSLISLAPLDASPSATVAATSLPNGLKKEVFGFLPYWVLSATQLQWMRYDYLSTIAYFGVAAQSNGTLSTSGSGLSGWNSSAMTNVINAAHSRGDKVVLTITMMAWDSTSAAGQATLLGSSTYRAALVSNIVAAVKSRNADGVNLDFEPLSTTLRDQYTSFVKQLKAGLAAAGVGAYVSVCTMAGAATWSTGYDIGGLTAAGAADALFVMGYDYSWSGSSRAGGVAPMSSSYMLDVNESVNDYLSETSGSKLIWGVPYYGRTWYTTSNALNSSTVSGASGQSKAYYYTGALSLANQYGRKWDSLGQVPWFSYQTSTGQWIEGYYDDPTSLGVKYDMINRRGLGGVGIWHLLMDQGVSELWNLLANKFQQDTVPPTGGITSLPPATDGYAIGVSWHALDVGSGVASYTVQVRDRATATWTTWLGNTTATTGTYVGTPGHTYEFRVSAKDKLGNAQPWTAPMTDPGSALAVGGFASAVVDGLNVRSGAGTGFTSLTKLAAGARVGILAGPISSGGYTWYQIQFGFSEWPSADYPRTGWAAADASGTAYLVPAVAPTVTRVQPAVSGYATNVRAFSPNGDGRLDSVGAQYTLAVPASVRLDVLSAAGATIATVDAGSQAAASHVIYWNGKTAGGAWAPAGTYLLRVSATVSGATHVAPANQVDATILATWGVTADVTPPTVTAFAPTGSAVGTTASVTADFSEDVFGVDASTVSLTDTTTGSPVAGSVSYNATQRRATVAPSSPLPAGHSFRVSIASAIRDRAYNPLAAKSWTFATPSDVQLYNPPKGLVFLAGTTVGYQFDASGRVIASKAYTLPRASGASADRRSKAIPGHSGAWFHIINGIWANYWVLESSRVYLPGIAEQIAYTGPQQVTFAAGTYTGVRFSSSWGISAKKTYSLPRASGASADRWAIINGRQYAHIINGIWAGYWMPLGGGATLLASTTQGSTTPSSSVTVVNFASPRQVTFQAGTYTGVLFDAAWKVAGTKPYTLPRASGASADRSAVISGKTYVKIINGIWAGYWMPLGGGVALK